MFNKVKLFFSKLSAWFRMVTLKGRQFLKKEIPTAITVVESIKAAVESPFTPAVTNLIPGDLDDKAVAILKAWLPKVLASLHIAHNISEFSTNNEIIQETIKALRAIPKVDRKGKYLELAAKFSEALSDGVLTWTEAVPLIHGAYELKFGKSK